MNELLVTAHAALWLCIAVLAGLAIVLRRQVMLMFERVAPAGALMVNAVLRVGQPAPRVAVVSLTGQPHEIGQPADRSQLLLFVSPECPITRSLLPVLRSLSKAEGWLDILFASDGDDVDVHRQFVNTERLTNYPYVLSEALGRAYGVSKVPYAILIDEAGHIAAMGIVNSREHLESLFEAKERKVASVQDYLRGHTEPSGDYHEVR